MDDEKKSIKECAKEPTPKKIQECYEGDADNTLSYISNLYRNTIECTDSEFVTLRKNFIVPMMNLSIEKMIDILKQMAAGVTPISIPPPAPMSFIKLTFDIDNGMKERPGCFRQDLARAQTGMGDNYRASKNCYKKNGPETVDACLQKVIDDIRALFDSIDKSTRYSRCSDFYLYPIQIYAGERFQNTAPEDLLAAIKAFAQAPLGSAPTTVVSTPAASPSVSVAPITPAVVQSVPSTMPVPSVVSMMPMPSMMPAPTTFAAPIAPVTAVPTIQMPVPTPIAPKASTISFDLVDGYYRIKNGLSSAGCLKFEMSGAVVALEAQWRVARDCLALNSPAAVDGCLNNVVNSIRIIFQSIDARLQSFPCVDYTLGPIRTAFRNALSVPNVELIDSVRNFARSNILPAARSLCIDLSAVLNQLSAKMNDHYGCSRRQIDLFGSYLTYYRNDARNCANYGGNKSMVDFCYNAIGGRVGILVQSIAQDLTINHCNDWSFSQMLRETLDNFGKCSNDDLTNAVKAFVGA